LISEGTDQFGERLLHLIGRNRHPRLQQQLGLTAVLAQVAGTDGSV
jgi:hypothetical protein